MSFLPDNNRLVYWTYPNNPWFEEFARGLRSPDIRIRAESSEGHPAWYAWSSPHIDAVSSRRELIDRTAALKAVFDGTMYVVYGKDYWPLNLGNPEYDDPGDPISRCSELMQPDLRVEPFESETIKLKFSKHTHAIDHAVSLLLFLSRYDDIAKNMLKYIGFNGLTYITLYAVKDWIQHGGWTSDEFARQAGWSKAKLSDFTRTANSPVYLGPYCRHGGVGAPPARPMELPEARVGVMKALRRFLRWRAEKLPVAAYWQSLAV